MAREPDEVRVALVRLAAEILASEAQHWTLLRALQTPQDLAGASPVAFVTP